MEENKVQLLLIEDNESDSIHFIKLIQDINGKLKIRKVNRVYEVKTANTINQGLECLQAHLFHLVILDLGLPDSKRLQGVRRILTFHNKTPIVIITRNTDEKNTFDLANEGVSDFIPKSDLNALTLEKTLFYVIEQRTYLNQINRKSQLETIGTLVTAISHDLNNLFSTIFLNIEVMKNLVSTMENGFIAESMQESIEELFFASKRGTEMIKNLSSFSKTYRKRMEELDVNDINNVITEIVGFLRKVRDENFIVELDLTESNYQVLADRTMLYSAILNLAVNARDAIKHKDKGLIGFTTSLTVIEEPRYFSRTKVPPGEYLLISVQDNGTGISQFNQQKLFEPFFTTKTTGKGTGLGLTNVLKTLNDHNGFIYVKSELDKGSTFNVLIPLLIEPPFESVKTKDKSTQFTDNVIFTDYQPRVLIIDDDLTLRRSLAKNPWNLGFKVISPSKEEEAVKIFEQRFSSIDFVILDLQLYYISGWQIFYRLIEINPDVKIIIISGSENINKEVIKGGENIIARMPKPFDINELVKVIYSDLSEDEEFF